MNLKLILCSLLVTAAAITADAHQHSCSKTRGGKKPQAKTTVADPQEDLYDVLYVKMDIEATNVSTAISGHVSTRAKVAASSMTDYVFELSPQLTIDSARLDGQTYTVASNGFIHTITLPAALGQNTEFTAEVFYHGAPTGGTGFFTIGILHGTDAAGPADVTHTVSAAIHSRDWWPCKQSLTDKIDSADIWVTVPAGLKVAGNGLLENVTPVPSGDRYEWSTRYPVDYYLLSFATAPYIEYNYYMHFSSNDSMLIQNYIYDNPAILTNHQDELDSIGLMIEHFSDIFGKYPYHKEKFGICLGPLSGGMENQTMVTLGSLEPTLIAHELAHQWWGNNVTCQTWKDIWLNEGWATYVEDLFLEHFHGPAAAQTNRTDVFNYIMQLPGGSVYVDDTTDELRIYDGRLTYYKGSAAAHMLRYMINDDDQFFDVLRQYHQQYAFSTATTADLQAIAEQVSGQDLDTFFKQWVYKEGYPTYGAKWAQDANQQVVIRLTQTTSKPSSVSLFKMPVEIKLTSAQGDTVIRVFNEHPVQYYSFQWNKAVTGMSIDPNNHIVNRANTILPDAGILNVSTPGLQSLNIYPNPATDSWNISNAPQHARLTLSDVSGRQVWQSEVLTDTVGVPCGHLAPGTYVLTVRIKNKPAVTYHLLR